MARGRLFLGKFWEELAITLIYCFNTDWMLGGATINLQEKKALMRRGEMIIMGCRLSNFTSNILGWKSYNQVRRGKINPWMQTFQFHILNLGGLSWKSYNQVRQGKYNHWMQTFQFHILNFGWVELEKLQSGQTGQCRPLRVKGEILKLPLKPPASRF